LFTKDGAIHTPIADCFLNGITRQTVIGLARAKGIEVVERRILPEELASFEECFICGTGAEVTPVAEIGPYNFAPGAISRALIEEYTKATQPRKAAA
jgi:branched-chain amino acid aminotransferase